MYRKIVIGHDLHSGGRDALALGAAIAGATGAKLVIAGVFPFGSFPRGFEERWRQEEAAIAAELGRLAEENGAEAEAFPSSSPARGLHELAEEIGADLVVVGSSRHSAVGQILAGNVGRNLLHGAPCAVAIAPKGHAGRGAERLRRIVVGLDGSVESRLALEDAVELARASGAGLRLVAVARAPQLATEIPGSLQAMEEAIEDSLREALGDALASIPAGVATEASLITGDPAAKLCAAADTASLLVLGSRGYGPARRVLLGSVSSALVAGAPCPVLVRPRAVGVGDAAPAPAPALRTA